MTSATLSPGRGVAGTRTGLAAHPLRRRAIQAGVIALFLLGWELFSRTPVAETAMFPGFLETFARLGELIFTGAYWSAFGSTVYSWAMSMVISIVIGVPLGLIIGRSRAADRSTSLLIDFLRTIPSIALIPLALLIVGVSNAMVILVAVLAAVWPILIQSIYAARSIDPMLSQVSRAFRLRPIERIRFVLAPDVAAFIWPGLRLAVTTALLVGVGAELIGSAPGIGSQMQVALSQNQQSAMLAYVVTAAALGLIFNMGLSLLQEKLLWWHPSMRKGER